MKIHQIIKENRKRRGMTQEELAGYLGVSAPAVNKWERGLSYPDITLLPIIAAYFNLSVDELLGYEPQMVKEDIKKLYHHLAAMFGTKPYEIVKAKCEEYIKKYHACFPLLLQMAVLYLNHLKLAPNSNELLEEAIELLDCVAAKSEDVHLSKEAVLMKSGCFLIMQKPQEVLEVLGEDVHELSQEAEMQAQAYQMKGDSEKAKDIIQVCIYQHLLMMVGDSALLTVWEQETPEKAEEVIRRTQAIMKLFHIDKLHLNVYAQTTLSFAQYFCKAQRFDEAMAILEQFADYVLSQDLQIELHGDDYFDRVEGWLSELALGKEPPRSKESVRNSILQSVSENPDFECLNEYPRYQRVIKRLEGLFK